MFGLNGGGYMTKYRIIQDGNNGLFIPQRKGWIFWHDINKSIWRGFTGISDAREHITLHSKKANKDLVVWEGVL